MRNIFFEKWYAKCGREISPRPLSKKTKSRIPLDQQSKVLCGLFLLYAQADSYRNILKRTCRLLAFISFKDLPKKQKSSLRLVSLLHFMHDFWGKIFLTLYSIDWPNLITRLLLIIEILGNMCIVIVCFPGCDVKNFRINISYQVVFPYDHKG